MKSIRLNKFISDSGICSRREADRHIEQGNVFVNGKRASVGISVTKNDKVLLNGLLIEPKKKEDLIVIALNKPRGIVSTTEKTVEGNITGFVGYHERIFPIGRLDKDSQGLIFLTNDGDIVNKILRAGNAHEKEYIVQVDKPITDEFIEKMSAGVPILGQMTKKCKVEKISADTFRIILIQGLNRQIRRMSEYFGYEVIRLERVRIMNINLKGLAVGDWRYLNHKELEEIHAAIADSPGEFVAGKTGSQQKDKAKSEKNHRSTVSEILASNEKSTSKSAITFHNPKSKLLRKKGKSQAKFGHKSRRRG